MAEFKMPSWSARNPLGIVALFISLIYGMSALLLGASVRDLLPFSQIVLVLFIVLFPILVLLVFAWLVSRHHTKLYGPGDYRSDKGFLDAGSTENTRLVGKRLEEELEEEELEGEELEEEEEKKEELGKGIEQESEKASRAQKLSPKETINRIIFSSESDRYWRLNSAYVAEGLVFQALQSELGGSVQREVNVGISHLDGLIYRSDGGVTAVEIKIWSSTANYQRRIREAHMFFQKLRPDLEREGILNVSFLLAIVVDGNAGRVSELKSKIDKITLSFDVRVFQLAELMRRFGFDEGKEKMT